MYTMDTPFLWVYYVTYLGGCAALIFFLGRLLHRSGLELLRDAFGSHTSLVGAVSRLLDIGFYMMSLGFVGASWQLSGLATGYGWAVLMAVQKLGWFLLFLGPVHLFNLLLLALFRRRTVLATPAAAS